MATRTLKIESKQWIKMSTALSFFLSLESREFHWKESARKHFTQLIDFNNCDRSSTEYRGVIHVSLYDRRLQAQTQIQVQHIGA